MRFGAILFLLVTLSVSSCSKTAENLSAAEGVELCGKVLWKKSLRGVPASHDFLQMGDDTVAMDLEIGGYQDKTRSQILYFSSSSGEIVAQKDFESSLSEFPLVANPGGSFVAVFSSIAGSTVLEMNETGEVVHELKGPYNRKALLSHVAYTPDGHLLLASDGHVVSDGTLWFLRQDGSVAFEVKFDLRTVAFLPCRTG